MSFIGPRPDTPMYLDKYTEEERIVLTVRPGITGYNQAVNRNSVLTKEKLKNDIYYVKHLSIGFDIKILFMTVATVLGHKNINRADTDTGNTYILNSNETAATNQSMSVKGVLRGLHFQKQYPQCKLVRAVRGTVFDVAVDLRADSKTYGKWYGVTLSAENKVQFLIPEGFAHGFLVLSDEAEFCYKVNDFYHPNDEGGMAWNDPEIGIEWPELKGEYQGSASAEGYTLADGTALILSDKDQKWMGLKDTFKF